MRHPSPPEPPSFEAAAARFPATSRYAQTPTGQWTAADGRSLPYLRRRFVGDPSGFVALAEHRVSAQDRMDRLAAAVYGDPEAFWRLSEGNGCLDPRELEIVGRRLRLTLPAGMAGPSDA